METVAEIWRAVPDATHYEASNMGRVRSVEHERRFVTGIGQCRRTFPSRILTPFLKRGYYHVSLARGHGRRQRPVHQLVAAAFIGLRQEGMATNHINGIKTDNRPENLEYITNSENVHHAYRTGLLDNSGERSPASKLTTDAVREIRESGTATRTLSEKFGISTTHIHRVRSRKVWKHIP